MSTLGKYIFRQLVLTLVFATAALMAMLWLIHSLRFFEDFFEKSLSLGVFLRLTLLMMPAFLTVFLPLAVFGSILFVYNKLSVDRELTVMQAAGISRLRIGVPALILGLLSCAGCYYLTLIAVPALERDFNRLRFEIQHEVGHMTLKEGAFTMLGDTITVYVREKTAGGELHDLLIHDRTQPNVDRTITAQRGVLNYDESVARVMLVKGVQQELDRGTGQVTFLYFDSHTIPLGDPEEETVRYPKSRERPLGELFTLDTGDVLVPGLPYTFTESAVRRMRMEGHQRLSKPLANLGFTLLALGTLLGAAYDRQNRRGRAVLALSVVLVVLAQAADIGIASLARTDMMFLPFLYASPLLTGLLGLWWLLRPPRRPARRRAPRRVAPQAA